jgi:hypothetical protein
LDIDPNRIFPFSLASREALPNGADWEESGKRFYLGLELSNEALFQTLKRRQVQSCFGLGR